jgi:hypothetical protein
MKRTLILVLAVFALTAASFAANPSGAATLAVSATVAGSVQIVISQDASGAALTNGGTNAASLAFGTVSATTASANNITITNNSGASTFTVSTPVDVKVTLANSTSSKYTLTAQLSTNDGNTWTVGGVAVTNGSAAQITNNGSYGTATSEAVAVTIPYSLTSGTVNNTITFTATAN